ncbi:erythromycin esterase family protein [Hymenobacter sp. YC55]|uniref:erythromycin esterase family protein n=1 Tax=Hymenobacter sp. YC55 TaxID=3034019 RepID=UPI0023F929F1|nr:erythromycin esterase family protein [Hymenobacter sp. YC55]MDF7813036.1 erythromycin esterase family protein [Hymenobacter sp. YC55]
MLPYLTRIILWTTVLVSSLPAAGQAIHNLDFEPEANGHQPLLLWSRKQQLDELLIRVDTVAPAQHGRGSLLLDASRAEEPEGTVIYISIPATDSLRGRIVTVSAWVRTENFQGRAWLRAYSSSNNESLKYEGNLSQSETPATVPNLPPTANWQRLQIQLSVNKSADNLAMMLIFTGKGKLWLDNFAVQWEGGSYHDAPLAGTEPLLLPPGTPLPDWDFERRGPTQPRTSRAVTSRWQLDSTVARHGRRSLRVEAAGPAPVYLGVVPLDSLQGKTLTVRGYIRYGAPATPGDVPPLLLHRILSNSDRHSFPYDRFKWAGTLESHSLPTPVAGTTEWQRFEATVLVHDNRNHSALSLLVQPGGAPIWLDQLELLADGRSFTPKAPPVPGQPTTAELAWLRKAAVPLRTTAPEGDQKDLAAFGQLVGKSSIIGLGEVTHGSHEQMQLKHRLFRYLVEQKGARVLALSADLGACLALNDYLQTGKGSPQQLVAELATWDTAEMLALVRWMRTYNEQATNKLQLVGIDIEQAPEGLQYLRQQLPDKPGYLGEQLTALQRQLRELPDLQIALNPLQQPTKSDPRLDAVRRVLTEVRTAYDVSAKLRGNYGALPAEAAALTQLLRVAEQFSVWQTLDSQLRINYRAACLAENVQWARAQADGGRVVVWANNAQLSTYDRDYQPLGEFLRRQFGAGYVNVGLAFHEGSFRALRPENPPAFFTAVAAPSAVGSYEQYFHAAGLPAPATLLDLRSPTLLPGTQWLHENLLLRDGALKPYTQPFSRHSLRREFDALLYLPKSTPAQAVR